MFSNLMLGLTILTYILLLLFNLNRVEGTGDQNVGVVIGFYLLLAYVISSLILTISVAANGGFHWISNSTFRRNVVVIVLWLGMMAGVIVCTMNKAEISFGDKLTGIERLFARLIYNGGIWLPLLMLLPYASFLNPDWRYAIAPDLVKMPLLLGCAIGLITLVTQKKVRPWVGSKTVDYQINKTIRKINRHGSIMFALYYVGNQDKRLHNAALNRIKHQKNYEDEFLKIFEGKYVTGISWVYRFWDDNKVEHPERFINPINNALPNIISEFREALINPYKADVPLNAEVMYRVMDQQFKESSDVFRSNMLKLQEVLAKTPAKRAMVDSKEYNETLNKYRFAVKNWLETNK